MITAKSKPEKYLTELSGASATILSDVPVSLGGAGEHLGPFRLLESSLAACMDITLRKAMESRNIPFDGVSVTVTLDEETEGKTIFRYKVDITGDLDEATKRKVLKISEGCPVRKLLSKQIEFVSESDVLTEG